MIRLSTLLILLLLPIFPLSSVTETDTDNESFVIEAIIPGQSNGQPFSNLVVVDLTGGSSDTHTVVQSGDQFYIGRGEQLQSGMDLFEIHYVTNNPAGSTITVTLGDFTKAVWNGNSYVVEDPTSPTTLESTVGLGPLSWIGSGSYELWTSEEYDLIPHYIRGDQSGQMNLYPDEGYVIDPSVKNDNRKIEMTFPIKYFTLSWANYGGGYWSSSTIKETTDLLHFSIEFVNRFSVSITSEAINSVLNNEEKAGFYRMDVTIEVKSNS